MEEKDKSLLKRREIAFCSLHPDPSQARTAVSFLSDIDGILEVEFLHDHAIRVHYHLKDICLSAIEQLLERKGFHLDNNLMHRIRRALAHYTEDTLMVNMGCGAGESNCTQRVFIKSYQKREHGCQDNRPKHWRRYL